MYECMYVCMYTHAYDASILVVSTWGPFFSGEVWGCAPSLVELALESKAWGSFRLVSPP